MHALQVFPSDAIVQHHGCLAIMNVAFNSGMGVDHFVFSQLSLTRPLLCRTQSCTVCCCWGCAIGAGGAQDLP